MPAQKSNRPARRSTGGPSGPVKIPQFRVAFPGRVLVLGCGSVSQCLQPLLLRHLDMDFRDTTVALEAFELAGQTYKPEPWSPTVRLDVSRPSNGFAFHLRFPVHLEGP